MTLIDVKELIDYWKEAPPVHISVAAYLGIKPEGQSKDSQSFEDFLKATGGMMPPGMLGG